MLRKVLIHVFQFWMNDFIKYSANEQFSQMDEGKKTAKTILPCNYKLVKHINTCILHKS